MQCSAYVYYFKSPQKNQPTIHNGIEIFALKFRRYIVFWVSWCYFGKISCNFFHVFAIIASWIKNLTHNGIFFSIIEVGKSNWNICMHGNTVKTFFPSWIGFARAFGSDSKRKFVVASKHARCLFCNIAWIFSINRHSTPHSQKNTNRKKEHFLFNHETNPNVECIVAKSPKNKIPVRSVRRNQHHRFGNFSRNKISIAPAT